MRDELRRHVLLPEITEQTDRFFDMLLQVNDAHTLMLQAQGIITHEEAQKLLRLSEDLKTTGPEAIDFAPEREDLYLNLEAYVIEKLGPEVGGKLHTGRSRNDLYATLHRCRLRSDMIDLADRILHLRAVFLEQAEGNLETVIPGYTHMQPAQPITYGHYLLALANAFQRDFDRFVAAYDRVNVSPLGACALAGTGFPIDREMTARALGFDGIVVNTLDAVAARDYVAEVLFVLTAMLSNLSRLAQDHYTWATAEFSLIDVPDELTVGSSIMPQKRNPTILEHISAKVSHTLGTLVSAVTAMKSVPYTHSRATGSETLKLLWIGLAQAESAVELTVSMIEEIQINREIALQDTERNFSTVTEVADEMVRAAGLSFRTAYSIVKFAVRAVHEEGKSSADLTLSDFTKASIAVTGQPLRGLNEDVVKRALDPLENVKRRHVLGGPAPAETTRDLVTLRRRLQDDQSAIELRREKLTAADRDRQRLVVEVIGLDLDEGQMANSEPA